MYAIKVDRQDGIISVRLEGMMSTDEVSAYVEDLRRAFIIHRLSSYAILIDVSRFPIQSQDMIAAMRAHMAAMPKARSIAVVTGSSLAKMQARRVFTQPYARIVADEADGHAWVRAGVEPAASGAAVH